MIRKRVNQQAKIISIETKGENLDRKSHGFPNIDGRDPQLVPINQLFSISSRQFLGGGRYLWLISTRGQREGRIRGISNPSGRHLERRQSITEADVNLGPIIRCRGVSRILTCRRLDSLHAFHARFRNVVVDALVENRFFRY